MGKVIRLCFESNKEGTLRLLRTNCERQSLQTKPFQCWVLKDIKPFQKYCFFHLKFFDKTFSLLRKGTLTRLLNAH